MTFHTSCIAINFTNQSSSPRMTLISSEIGEKDGHIALLKSIRSADNPKTEDFAKLFHEKRHLLEKLRLENERKANVLAENDRLISELEEEQKDASEKVGGL